MALKDIATLIAFAGGLLFCVAYLVQAWKNRRGELPGKEVYAKWLGGVALVCGIVWGLYIGSKPGQRVALLFLAAFTAAWMVGLHAWTENIKNARKAGFGLFNPAALPWMIKRRETAIFFVALAICTISWIVAVQLIDPEFLSRLVRR
jgi:hypothetical protein